MEKTKTQIGGPIIIMFFIPSAQRVILINPHDEYMMYDTRSGEWDSITEKDVISVIWNDFKKTTIITITDPGGISEEHIMPYIPKEIFRNIIGL